MKTFADFNRANDGDVLVSTGDAGFKAGMATVVIEGRDIHIKQNGTILVKISSAQPETINILKAAPTVKLADANPGGVTVVETVEIVGA